MALQVFDLNVGVGEYEKASGLRSHLPHGKSSLNYYQASDVYIQDRSSCALQTIRTLCNEAHRIVMTESLPLISSLPMEELEKLNAKVFLILWMRNQ